MVVLLNVLLPPVIAGALAWFSFETGWHAALFFVLTWAVTGSANSLREQIERIERRNSN
jgi:hypothetical protein